MLKETSPERLLCDSCDHICYRPYFLKCLTSFFQGRLLSATLNNLLCSQVTCGEDKLWGFWTRLVMGVTDWRPRAFKCCSNYGFVWSPVEYSVYVLFNECLTLKDGCHTAFYGRLGKVSQNTSAEGSSKWRRYTLSCHYGLLSPVKRPSLWLPWGPAFGKRLLLLGVVGSSAGGGQGGDGGGDLWGLRRKDPMLIQIHVLHVRDESFSFIKKLQVSSLLKDLNGKLFLKHSFFLIKVFCKIGFS